MRHGKARFVAGFLALPLALYVWYVVWPFAQSIGYSFTDWGGYSDEQHFVGFANYVRLFNDELIRMAFWHNVFFLITVPLITIALALFFAFLLNVGGRGNRAGIRGVWGSSVYKIIFFFPQVLSLVLIAVMWQAIYRGDDQGLLNGLLIKTGLVDKDHPLGFVADPTPFLGVPGRAVVDPVHRGVGRRRLLPGAVLGRHAVDPEGHLRGGAARRGQPVQTRSSGSPCRCCGTPSRSPGSTWASSRWTCTPSSSCMTPSQGGPNHASEIFASVINFTAFNSSRSGRYGYACAMGVALAIFTIILAVLQLRITRRERIEY